MAFELKDGQGTLFRNDKEGNEARPDYRGEVKLSGTVYRVSGWLKEGKNGKWMSLSVDAKPGPASQYAPPPPARQHSVDDDIPF